MTPALAAVLAYLVLQLGVGIWVARRIASESDYLIAGRSLGYTLATFSIFATWFGAETTIGSAGTAYAEGVGPGSAEPFGYGLCLVLMGLVFAGPLRRRGLVTLADLYRQRYSPLVERTAAIVLVPGSVLWAAAQVRAFGTVLATSSNALDVDMAIRLAAAFTVLYTMFGGLLADAINDLIQGILLILGLVVLLVAAVNHLGGIAETAAAVRAANVVRQASIEPVARWAVLEAWAIPVLGSVLATELVGRVVATRNERVAQRSSVGAGMLYLAIGLIPLLLGVIGPVLTPGLGDPEQLLPTTARALLPTLGYAVFAGGLVAAILSTVDSTLLTASSLASHNLLVPALRLTSERAKVRLARGCVLVFGALAYALALRSDSVFELVEQASAFGSAGAVVTVTFGLFTRIGGATAAFSTLLAGVVTYLAGSYGGAAYPFLLSLGAALGTYLLVAMGEHAGVIGAGSAVERDRSGPSG